MNLKLSHETILKLRIKHNVLTSEIEECFLNRTKGLLEDTREHNKTCPPTLWFIAETNYGRSLKIVFIELSNGQYQIKSAYEPNDLEVEIYEKYA
ncbi:MAG TPA: ADP-ribosyl-(dinitrogen reductase) hydrolase [Gammaproteobacteria bacterium]|nr:ADP-ribosyl-(dinitrogen reductase) hydrolase [Gammaproteobacteria bacterium]